MQPFSSREGAAGNASQTHTWSRPVVEKKVSNQPESPHAPEPFILSPHSSASPKTFSFLRRSVSEMALRSNVPSSTFEIKMDFQSNVSLEVEEASNGRPTVWRLVKDTSVENTNSSSSFQKNFISKIEPHSNSKAVTHKEKNIATKPFVVTTSFTKTQIPKSATFLSMILLPNKKDHHVADVAQCKNGTKRVRVKDNDELLKVENSDFVILNASTNIPSPILQSHRNAQTRANQV